MNIIVHSTGMGHTPMTISPQLQAVSVIHALGVELQHQYSGAWHINFEVKVTLIICSNPPESGAG